MESPREQTAALTPTSFHILLALAGEPLHGYGVMLRVQEAGLKVGPGTIYGALHRMQQDGWVKRSGAEKARGPLKQRQRYTLTRTGRRTLQHEARRLVHAAKLVRQHAVLADDGDAAK